MTANENPLNQRYRFRRDSCKLKTLYKKYVISLSRLQTKILLSKDMDVAGMTAKCYYRRPALRGGQAA